MSRPVREVPEVVPPVAALPAVLPPVSVCPTVLRPLRETPRVSPPVREVPEVVPPPAQFPAVLPPVSVCPAVLPPVRETPRVSPPVRRAPEVVLPLAQFPAVLPPVSVCPAVLPPARETPQVSPPVREVPEVVPPVPRVAEVLAPVYITPQILPPVRQLPEVPPPRLKKPEREREAPVDLVVRVTKKEYPTESSSTWLAAKAQLRERYETSGDKIVRVAWTAAGKLSALAKIREKPSISPPPAADASRIMELVQWLLELARLVLEQLGLMNVEPAPGSAGAPQRSLAQQLEIHVLPHAGEQLAVANESFTDLKAMLDNDDDIDTEARGLLERLEAEHADDAEERDRAESSIHWREIGLALSAAERERKQKAASKLFGWPAAAELDTDERRAIARDVIRTTLPGLRDRIRSFCRERRVVKPPPARPAAASQPSSERGKELDYDDWTR